MGLTISSLLTRLRGKKEMRIVMVGFIAGGKTTILYKLKLDQIVMTIPTSGINVETLEWKNTCFEIWDIGYHHPNIWRQFFPNARGIIFVVDSHDRDYIQVAKEQLDVVLQADELEENAVLLVFANKQDLPNAMSTTELAEIFGLNSLQKRSWHIQGASAITGQGIYEGLDWLNDKLAEK